MSEPDAPGEAITGRHRTVKLHQLYLDPNNYRFIDHVDYRPVDDERATDSTIQRRTTALLLGVRQAHIADLLASIRANGWLPVDHIQVRQLGRARYLVVEGNRRVATLKHLHRRYQDAAIDLGRLNPSIFESVPVVLYDEPDALHHLVVAGLNHISGKRRWPAINRARLMRRLGSDFAQTPEQICAALGITKREYNLSVRTLGLVEQYQASDYGDQFTSPMYNLFREILKSPALRGWLDWSHSELRAGAVDNVERLFSWISREVADDDDDDGDMLSGEPRSRPPAVTTVAHIRELGRVIDDPKAVAELDATRSLAEAVTASDLIVKREIDKAISRVESETTRLFAVTGQLSDNELTRLEAARDRIGRLLNANYRQPELGVLVASRRPFNEAPNSRFSTVRIHRYRRLDDIELAGAGRVNIIAGANNAGKTSVLEAIHLLAHQVDERALLDLIVRRRARISQDPPIRWLMAQLPDDTVVEGVFDTRPARVEFGFTDEVDPEVADQAFYLGRLDISASWGDFRQTSATRFFENRARTARYTGRNHWLCQSLLQSPFSSNPHQRLTHCHRASVQAGSKRQVVEFLRAELDHGLVNIELVDEFERFIVTHDDLRSMDLSAYGEGMRRIFHTSLLFAGARGGVVLIDEFENAIHFGLLPRFARFVLRLAKEFEVQVFLTTHSREAIEAFVVDHDMSDAVVGYGLIERAGCIAVDRVEGPRLSRLIDVVGFDLRGT